MALAALMTLTACESAGGSSTTTALPTMLKSASRVEAIRMTGAPTQGVSADFATVFEAGVREKLDECAKGSTPLTLDVTLTDFDRANPAMTWLVADSNTINGTARLLDASGQVVGEYVIARRMSGAGLIGIAMMAQAEDQMSAAFGAEVCKQAFGYNPYARDRAR